MTTKWLHVQFKDANLQNLLESVQNGEVWKESSPQPRNPDPQDFLQQLQASEIVHLCSNFQQPETAGAKSTLHDMQISIKNEYALDLTNKETEHTKQY